MERKGLDISTYQKGINFSDIKASGNEFLILRAGFTGWGTGVNYNVDDCFENFYKQAKDNNIPVGAYWYSCANTYDKGVAEANYMYEKCLKGKQFEYPIYIDVEDTHHQVGNKDGVTKAIIGFCETLENKGYYVGIYASDISGFKEKINLSQLDAYVKWVAIYGGKPSYVKTYGMWQYSSKGRINGYNGYLDMNIAYKDYPTIIKNAGLNGFRATKKENGTDTLEEPKKTLEEVANEVIANKWGTKDTNPTRKQRLESAGYDYQAVQNRVNEILHAQKQDSYTTYTVQKGDYLIGIANKLGKDWKRIAGDNGIKSPKYTIYTGQVLKIY